MKAGIVAALLIAVPLAFLIWLRTSTSDRLPELEVAPGPSLMHVTQSESFEPQGAAIVFTWSDPPEIPTPPFTGTVTRVIVSSGDLVRNGDFVVEVDGIKRMAYQSEVPLFRPLRRGDKGDDVMTLETFLTSQLLFHEQADSQFTTATGGAVEELGQLIGVPSSGLVFSPSWLVWIGPDPFRVGDIFARIGFPAPAPGAALLSGVSVINDVRITAPDGSPLDLSGGRLLQMSDFEIVMEDGRIADSELQQLSNDLKHGTEQGMGTVLRLIPRVAFVVPATALVADADGSLCVFLARQDHYEPVMVEIGGGRVSTVDIVDGLAEGDALLVNPSDVIDRPACH